MSDTTDELDLTKEYLQSNPAALSPELRAEAAKAMGLSPAEVNQLIEEISKNYVELDPDEVSPEDVTGSTSMHSLALWQERRNEFYNSAHDEKGRFTTGDGTGGGVPAAEQQVINGLHPTIQNSVASMLTARRQVEPGYTKLLSDTAKASGGEMQGLPHKFKDAQGIVDKITRKVRDKGITPEQAAASIGDSLRYTMTLPPGKYLGGITAAVKALQDKGVEFQDFEDNWKKGDAYNGINAVFKDKDTGLKVELQFHTPESFHIKDDVIHGDYEFIREHKGTSAQRLLAHERMRQASDSVEFPAGISTIGDQIAGVKVTHLFRPTQETLFAAAGATIPVTSFEDAERLYDQGVMNQDDWEEFVDGYFGYGPPFPGYIYPNLTSTHTLNPQGDEYSPITLKAELAGRVEQFTNDCHDETGRFCETTGGGGTDATQYGKDPLDLGQPAKMLSVHDFDHIPYEDDPSRLTGLMEDIKKNGFKIPIEVSQYKDEPYMVEDGRHRLEAARRLGITRIPAVVIKTE